jgi:hypothetical protein
VLVAITIAAAFAPPREFDLLRARRVRGTVLALGVPLGRALAYALHVDGGPARLAKDNMS